MPFNAQKETQQTMLENTKVTQETIDILNESIAGRAKKMAAEAEWAEERGNEKIKKECQEIAGLFEDKRLVFTEEGTIDIQEPDN